MTEIERLRLALESERALVKKIVADSAAERVRIMALQGELHELWENAQLEMHDLLRNANKVPGLSAELDRVRWERDKAVGLLHMLDRDGARHPDVAEFLDSLVTT